MRNILVLFTAFLLNYPMIAQEPIPVNVRSALYVHHPTAEGVYWEHRKEGIVANFQTPNGLTKVFFQEDGQWLETRIRTGLAAIPNPITQYLDEHFAKADISYAGKTLKPDGSTVYRIESELPSEIVVKIFDEEGMLLQEQRIPFQEIELQDAIFLPEDTEQ